MMAKAGLRNSLGCSDMPRLSQRRAPLTENPATGTNINPANMAKPSTIPNRRAVSRLNMLVPNMAIKPSNCHRRWMVKKCRSSSLIFDVERRRALAGLAAATAAVPIAISTSTSTSSVRSISRHQIASSLRRLWRWRSG